MSVNRILLLLSSLIAFFAATSAAEQKDLGAHFKGDSPFRDSHETAVPENELEQIRSRMMERGTLERDRKVLGTFWGESPLGKGQDRTEGASVTSPAYREYRHIIETRCLLCHERDRIDEALEKELPFHTMEEIMMKRQVILTPWEREVVKTFWGTPFKP